MTARAAVAAMFAVGCFVAPSTPPSAASAAPSPGPANRVDWTGCGDRLECARVPVPLDWDHPNGRQIELAVIRHLASRPDAFIGSILINPGGPGDTGVGLVRDAGDELDTWGAGRFDIVGWDPRGTYGSSPVHCFENGASELRFWQGVPMPTTPPESRAYQRKTVELARRCGKVMGPLLSHISTADTARDLDVLRHVVGDRKLTYVGLSYGTMIGQTYANLFPGRVRAMMLDGLIDAVAYTRSAETRTANSSSSADEVFDKFQSLCEDAGPDRCALAGHGEPVAERVAHLFAAVRQAPIPAPNAQPPGELSYGDLLLSSFSPLRDPHTWPEYAQQLDAAAAGDASRLEDAARAARTPAAYAEATKSAAISCLDGPARLTSKAWPTEIARLARISELAGTVQGWWLWAPCASNWPARGADRYAGPWNAKTEHPILVIGTRYDPNTSYRNAQVAAKRLGNAVLLTHLGYGHLSTKDPSRCIEDARVRYLVEIKTPPSGTVCTPDEVPFADPTPSPTP